MEFLPFNVQQNSHRNFRRKRSDFESYSKRTNHGNGKRTKKKTPNRIKQIITENSCLAHYAMEKENVVTTNASKSGLGITFSQTQDNGEIKPIAFGSRYLNDFKKNYSKG